MTTHVLSVSWDDSTTAETYMNTTERPWQSLPFYIAARYLWKIYLPFVLLFGIFGNVMIIIIMRRATSGESAIHIYFIATAVFDMICLGTGTLRQWMQPTFGLDILATHNVICKIFTRLYTGGGTISAWCLVCMTAHRVMSVVWPHRVNVLCTRRTVLLVLAGITVFLALLYSHFLIGMERVFVVIANEYWCIGDYNNKNYIYFYINIFLYVELSVYSLLPFTVLAVSNGILVWKLRVSVKAANRKLTQGDSEQVQSREKAANSVTLTVIVVSLAFICFTLPNTILEIVNSVSIDLRRLSSYEYAKIYFINTLCELPAYTNLAVNFYLYCLTGRRFREEFIKVMCCGRNRRRRGPHQ